MPYKAIITRVYTRPHPNADRLQLGACRGYQVIVGKDVKDGELGVLFPPDGQLSHEYCMANNLYRKHPETGETMGGFFEANRRVTAARLRGEKSEAYFASLESLANLFGPKGEREAFPPYPVIGAEIDSFHGIKLCQKYETPATKRAQDNRRAQARKANAHFHKHFDTDQLRRAIADIPMEAMLYFTEKLHGTSQRSGYVIDSEYEPTWRDRLAQWIAGRPLEGQYEDLVGTRNVILGRHAGASYYGGEAFRYRVHDGIKDKLHKGEIVYYEVVGYVEEGKSIMPAVSTKDLPDVRQQYGEFMAYSYGCEAHPTLDVADPNPDLIAAMDPARGCAAYVYRITQQNADGVARDLSWEQVVGRAREIGLDTVPELRSPMLMAPTRGDQTAQERLMSIADELYAGPSTLDFSHIREGVAVRWEKGGKVGILKHKSFEFLVLEGVAKADETYIDTEEAS